MAKYDNVNKAFERKRLSNTKVMKLVDRKRLLLQIDDLIIMQNKTKEIIEGKNK